MKRCITLILCLLMLLAAARAEVDTQTLEQMEGASVFLDDGGILTVIRPDGQPFFGTTDSEEASAAAYLDYVEDPDADCVFLRLSISLEAWDALLLDTLTLTVGKTEYCFSVDAVTSEYDMVYQQDYTVCLTDVSLPLIRDMQ